MHVEPHAIRLGRVPRIIQVCLCGAVLLRGTRARNHLEQPRPYYFWTVLDEPREERPKVFRSEDAAGVHCSSAAAWWDRERWKVRSCVGIGGWRPCRFVKEIWSKHAVCLSCGNRESDVAHA